MNLKAYLSGKTKEQLTQEIVALSKSMPMVRAHYSNLLGGNGDLLDKCKAAIKREHFPSRGFGDARAGVVRKVIGDFKKISRSDHDLIDLLIYHVEQGVKYTNEYGDIDDRFYSSIETSFGSAMKLIAKTRLHKEYQERCLKIVDDTNGIGWGFHDCLADLYSSAFEKKR